MTTRINLRNISRKNLTVEIKPRNDGTATFPGEIPKNAIVENGAIKLTLVTKKIDRLGIVIGNDYAGGDFIIENIGDKYLGKSLLAWNDEYWDEGTRCASEYSLAQLGIGQNYSNGQSTLENPTDMVDVISLYNNTASPIVLGGVVDFNGAYFGDEPSPDGSMVEEPMTMAVSESSMVDGSMVDGSMVDGSEVSYQTVVIKTDQYLPTYQDPELRNPTFAQELGKWGVILGPKHHRAGTSVRWTITLPDTSSPYLTAILYIPYTHTDRFGNTYSGQATYAISRLSNEDPWDHNFYDISQNLASQMYTADNYIGASHESHNSEFYFNIGNDSHNPYTGNDPTGYGLYRNGIEVLPNIYDNEIIPISPTDLDYNDIELNTNHNIVLSGLRYVGLTTDNTNVDGNDQEIAYNSDNWDDGWVNEMADSSYVLHPQTAWVNYDEVPYDEETTVIINLARNTSDEDGLGYFGNNTTDFMVRSAGYNSTRKYYDADGNLLGGGPNELPPEMQS